MKEKILKTLESWKIEDSVTGVECIDATNFEIIAEELAILFAIPDVRLSLPDEDVSEPIQNALYATNAFTTDQCSNITDGILLYLKDAGFDIVKGQ